MKVSVTFQAETPDEIEALSALLLLPAFRSGVVNVDPGVSASPGPADKETAAPASAKGARKRKPPAAPPAEQPVPDKPEAQVETVDKALVAKELRAFIDAKGEKAGIPAALGVLKQFNVKSFPELPAEQYSRFLSALKRAA